MLRWLWAARRLIPFDLTLDADEIRLATATRLFFDTLSALSWSRYINIVIRICAFSTGTDIVQLDPVEFGVNIIRFDFYKGGTVRNCSQGIEFSVIGHIDGVAALSK